MSYSFGMPTLIEKGSILDNVILCKELVLDFVKANNLSVVIETKTEKALKESVKRLNYNNFNI